MTLLELAAKVEAAAKGNRELDNDIRYAAKQPFNAFEGPSYSTSIDAAMMLVPEGCVWELSQGRDGCSALVECGDVGGQAEAATPALALTAASLRARSENPA